MEHPQCPHFNNFDIPAPVRGPIVCCKNFPRPVPDGQINNGLLFSFANGSLVFHLSDVGMIFQNPVYMTGIPDFSLLCLYPVTVQLPCDQFGRLNLDKPLKDSLNDPRFFRLNNQLFVFHTVSHRNATADPFAFFPAGGHLVANPLGDDLPLILREGDENVEHHAPSTGGGIDFLRHRDKLCAPFVGDIGFAGLPLSVDKWRKSWLYMHQRSKDVATQTTTRR